MKRGCWCRATDECTNSLPHKRSAVTSMQHEAESIKQHVCKQSADLSPVLNVAAFPPTLLSVSSWTELHQVTLVDRHCCFSPAFLDSSSELCSPICRCSFRVSLRAICSPSRARHCLKFLTIHQLCRIELFCWSDAWRSLLCPNKRCMTFSLTSLVSAFCALTTNKLSL